MSNPMNTPSILQDCYIDITEQGLRAIGATRYDITPAGRSALMASLKADHLEPDPGRDQQEQVK